MLLEFSIEQVQNFVISNAKSFTAKAQQIGLQSAGLFCVKKEKGSGESRSLFSY